MGGPVPTTGGMDLRVLMIGRPDHLTKPGGDMLHLDRTAKALQMLGLPVVVDHGLEPDLAGIDVAHLFNLTLDQAAHHHAQRLTKAGIPYVVTPIFINAERYRQEGRPGGPLLSWMQPNQSRMGRVLQQARLVLANTRLEAAALQQKFGWLPIRVIPIGADRPIGHAQGDKVLCIGRIEPLKNQLRLVQALEGTGLPLVLAGPPSLTFPSYTKHVLNRLERMGGEYAGTLAHDEVPHLLMQGRVHVQPSWFETVGLASVEAAMHGLRVVITNEGFSQEVFGDHAWYVDPGDTGQIGRTVVKAYRTPMPTDFPPIASWWDVAHETLAAYRAAVQL